MEGLASEVGVFQRAAAASIFGELHVCGITNNGKIWHTVRATNGTWLPFGEVELLAGDIGTATDVDCTAVSGNLHVVASNSVGGLYHTVRRMEDGSWTPFGNVKAFAGDPGSVSGVSTSQFAGRLFITAHVGVQLYETSRHGENQWQAPSVGWNAFTNVNTLAGSYSFTSVGMD